MEENINTTTEQTTENQQTNNTTQHQNVELTQHGSTMKATVQPPDMNSTSESEQQSTQEETQNQSEETTNNLQEDMTRQQQAEYDVKADLKNKGIDFNKLATEFDTNGELSTESLSALEKAGYPKSIVDAYINGMQATADRFVNKVKAMAGGEQGYADLTRFIQTQPKAVIEAFNDSIRSNNLGQIKLAISGLQAQMKAAYGTANPTVMAGHNGVTGTTGYTTPAQMTKDMKDPRYQKDPAFTREVMRKVANATFF